MIWILIGSILASAYSLDTEAVFEPKVVNGIESDILKYGYSAFIMMLGEKYNFACGGSILNQKFVLTAAHCFDQYTKNTNVLVTVGHKRKDKGGVYKMKTSKVHENYNGNSIINDIALIMLYRDISLGPNMYRIALARSTPRNGVVGKIAGWGLINEDLETTTNTLRVVSQRVMSQANCRKYIPTVPLGTFCGINDAYPAQGDSGSAFILNGYLQIGIVSYKSSRFANIVVYTDVSRHRYWIKDNALSLNCRYS